MRSIYAARGIVLPCESAIARPCSDTGLVSVDGVTVRALIFTTSAGALSDDHLNKWENGIGQES